MIRMALVFWYLVYCLRSRALPWNFFQLNRRYFNNRKGIYSKLDLDRAIPEKWRLKQYPEDGCWLPESFPVFLKPEWGQNSHGILRVDSVEQLAALRRRAVTATPPRVIQQAAKGKREFELFYIRSPQNHNEMALFSLTETCNNSDDPYPINGIHNPATFHVDRTMQCSDGDKKILWSYLEEMGRFRLARVGVRAHSYGELVAGEFQVIEINLFLPMPLILLDRSVPSGTKMSFVKRSMALAAQLVKDLPTQQSRNPIFFKKLIAHYKSKACKS